MVRDRSPGLSGCPSAAESAGRGALAPRLARGQAQEINRANYARLVALKRHYDLANLFRPTQQIDAAEAQ